MSSQLSPILAAYFGGQKQQTDLISQAKELSDSAARRQQAQQELQQRQQTIDEIAKQHGVENDKAQQQLELASKIATDTHLYHMTEMQNNLREGMRSGAIPLQTTDVPTLMKSMGLLMTDSPTPQVTDLSGLPTPSQPPVTASVPVAQSNATQTFNTPYGDISLPQPKTAQQSAVEQAQSLLPIEIQKYKDTVGNMQDERMQAAMARLQDSLSNSDNQKDLQRIMLEKLGDMRVGAAETVANQRMNNQMLSWGLPPDPDAAKHMVAGYAADEAVGKGTGKDPRQSYGPVVGSMVQQLMNNTGTRVMPTATRDKVTGMGNDVSQTLATLQQLKDSVPVPNTLTGQASNYLADKFGVGGLSPYKSIYDSITTDIIPKMDVALGFTPGTLSRSPKLYDKIKSIAPLPGDEAKVVAQKTANAADIFFSGISKQLSGYSPAQRAAVWQDIINDHPELPKNYPQLRDKLKEAGTNGNYTPGTLYQNWAGGK